MIGLVGRHPKEPSDLVNDSKAAAKKLLAKAKATANPVFKEGDFPNHWGKYKHYFIRPQYNGKCAYCETNIIAGSPGDVEHFRPKAYCQALSSAKNRDDSIGKPPRRSNKGAATEGYWWLAYNWKNYLLSCNRCNSTWKKNQFPIAASRARRGTRLSSEKALLINPFLVNPERHFQFDFLTGEIRGLTPQGIATVDVCGLDRRSLVVQRQIKCAKLDRRYQEYVTALKTNNTQAEINALRVILDECRSKEPFAAVARYFAKHKLKISYPNLLAMKRAKKI